MQNEPPSYQCCSSRTVGARLRRFVRSDPSGVRAGFIKLLISSSGDLVAGLTLGSITGTPRPLPGSLVLVPAAIGMGQRLRRASAAAWALDPLRASFRMSRRARHAGRQNAAAAQPRCRSWRSSRSSLSMSVAFGIGTRSRSSTSSSSVVGAILSPVVVLVITIAVAAFCARGSTTRQRRRRSSPLRDVVTLPSLFPRPTCSASLPHAGDRCSRSRSASPLVYAPGPGSRCCGAS
jgi:hypothetical protein